MSIPHGTIRGNTNGVGGAYGTFLQPKSKRTDTPDGYVITDVYRALWSEWESTAPAIGSDHPLRPWATLQSRDASQIEPGILCEVTLTYEYTRGDAGSGEDGGGDDRPSDAPGRLPANQYAENAASLTIPIEQHPYFAAVSAADRRKILHYFSDPDPKNAPILTGVAESLYLFKLAGVNDYIVASVTETKTSYSWSKPSSVSGDVGTVDGSRKWLTISGGIFQQGNYWVKQITRQYSARGWEDHIYGGA